MAKVLIDIPDKYINWDGWMSERLAESGIASEPVQEEAHSEPESAPDDPWANPTAGATRSATTSPTTAPAPASSAASGQPAYPPSDYFKYTKEAKTHEFNVNGAPPCDHDQPAVRVSGKNAQGKAWKQYRCALSSTARWNDKCEFSQWA